MAENKYENECRTYLRIIAEERYLDDIMGAISQIVPCKKVKDSVVVGDNNLYDSDVNVMLRTTLGALMGNEQTLLELKDKYSAELWLIIVAYLSTQTSDPYPVLSLDRDIVEFLYKSGAEYDLDYYIV
ncbi:MAG: DUF4279 domain-containing protein [Candidatus Coproplasma sp.]